MKFRVVLKVPATLLRVADDKEEAFEALLSGFLIRHGITVLRVEKLKDLKNVMFTGRK